MNKENKHLIINSKYFGEKYLKKIIDRNVDYAKGELFFSESAYSDVDANIVKIKDEIEEKFEKFMYAQYMEADVNKVFKKYGEEEVINYLKTIADYSHKYSNVRIRTRVSEDEIEEFLNYIKDYELEKIIAPLNAKEFLKICRICYDAAPLYVFPKGISDYFVYKTERGTSFHEDGSVLTPEFYENDEEFIDHYGFSSYHFEELRFGGPCMRLEGRVIHNFPFDEKGDLCDETKWSNKTMWNGSFYSKTYDAETCGRAIKMYNALRRKGYPIVYFDPYKTLDNYLGHRFDEDRYGYKYFDTVDDAIKTIEGKA